MDYCVTVGKDRKWCEELSKSVIMDDPPKPGSTPMNSTEILLKKRQSWTDYCVALRNDWKWCEELSKSVIMDDPPKPVPECETLECFVRPKDKTSWMNICMKRNIGNCDELYMLLTKPQEWKRPPIAMPKKEEVCDNKKK